MADPKPTKLATALKYGLALAAANKAMSKFEQPDPIEFIKQQSALNAVQSALHDVISEIDNAIALLRNAGTTKTRKSKLSQIP